ncbi:uncharacterized protein LOC144919433 [Branchiostoma floridae x Branchiostoma belcheri]
MVVVTFTLSNSTSSSSREKSSFVLNPTALPSDVTTDFSPVVFNLTSCNGTERQLTECDHVFNDVAMATRGCPGRQSARVVCKVDGSWGSWTAWSSCNCPERVQSRMRSCTSPPPLHGGKNCAGVAMETRPCEDPCPDTCAVLRRAFCEKTDDVTDDVTDDACACLTGNASACTNSAPLWQSGQNGTLGNPAHSSAGLENFDLNFRIISGVNWTEDFLNHNSSAFRCLSRILLTSLQGMYSNSSVSSQCDHLYVHQLRQVSVTTSIC